MFKNASALLFMFLLINCFLIQKTLNFHRCLLPTLRKKIIRRSNFDSLSTGESEGIQIAKIAAETEIKKSRIAARSTLISSLLISLSICFSFFAASYAVMYLGAKFEHGMTGKLTDFERFYSSMKPKTFLLPFTGLIAATAAVSQLSVQFTAAVVKLASRFFCR